MVGFLFSVANVLRLDINISMHHSFLSKVHLRWQTCVFLRCVFWLVENEDQWNSNKNPSYVNVGLLCVHLRRLYLFICGEQGVFDISLFDWPSSVLLFVRWSELVFRNFAANCKFHTKKLVNLFFCKLNKRRKYFFRVL